jgi:ParB-like chromosome segregation protein Spo0J
MGQQEKICDYVIHPAASVFPLLEGERFQSLVDSIAEHGLQNPIVSYNGEVLDGRNRLRAVMKLRDEGHKVDLPCVEWDAKCGMSATEWVAAQNLDRRHLSADAYAAATAAINRILRKEAKERQKSGQAKAGQASKNPTGRRGKKTGGDQMVAASSRDSKKKDASSTAGHVAAKAGVSLRKAKQAVALDKAVEAGVISEEVQKDVIAGKKKLRDAVKEVPAKAKPRKKAAKKKQRAAADVLDDLRLLLQELLACDRVSKRQIVDELTTWIDRAQTR